MQTYSVHLTPKEVLAEREWKKHHTLSFFPKGELCLDLTKEQIYLEKGMANLEEQL